MDNLNEAKVGDTLFVTSRFTKRLVKVVRVTATQVIDNHDYRYIKKNGRKVGSDGWDTVWAKVASEEEIRQVHDEILRESAIDDLRRLTNNLDDYSTKAIMEVNKYLENERKHREKP